LILELTQPDQTGTSGAEELGEFEPTLAASNIGRSVINRSDELSETELRGIKIASNCR
jgi:hypothetical protein